MVDLTKRAWLQEWVMKHYRWLQRVHIPLLWCGNYYGSFCVALWGQLSFRWVAVQQTAVPTKLSIYLYRYYCRCGYCRKFMWWQHRCQCQGCQLTQAAVNTLQVDLELFKQADEEGGPLSIGADHPSYKCGSVVYDYQGNIVRRLW